jgi:hypothetical protein
VYEKRVDPFSELLDLVHVSSLAPFAAVTTLLSVPGTPPGFPPGGITLLPGGGVSLAATGAINSPCRLWMTTNAALPLANWTVLVSSTVSSSPFTNSDLTATNYPQRFCRFSNP